MDGGHVRREAAASPVTMRPGPADRLESTYARPRGAGGERLGALPSQVLWSEGAGLTSDGPGPTVSLGLAADPADPCSDCMSLPSRGA